MQESHNFAIEYVTSTDEEGKIGVTNFIFGWNEDFPFGNHGEINLNAYTVVLKRFWDMTYAAPNPIWLDIFDKYDLIGFLIVLNY